MRRWLVALAGAAAAAGLAGCATKTPVSGEFPPITPRAAQGGQYAGRTVRWGGVLIKTTPGAHDTCFRVMGVALDRSGRPRIDTGESDVGRFIACAKGFYDPVLYAAGREITFVGTIAGLKHESVGGYEYPYPRLVARVVHLWPKRSPQRPYRGYYYYNGGYYYPWAPTGWWGPGWWWEPWDLNAPPPYTRPPHREPPARPPSPAPPHRGGADRRPPQGPPLRIHQPRPRPPVKPPPEHLRPPAGPAQRPPPHARPAPAAPPHSSPPHPPRRHVRPPVARSRIRALPGGSRRADQGRAGAFHAVPPEHAFESR